MTGGMNYAIHDLMTRTVTIFEGDRDIAVGSVTDGCIHDVEVAMEYRRHGYGTTLVKSLMLLGGSWMWVAASNMPAISLYSSLGFRITETDGGYYRMQLTEE